MKYSSSVSIVLMITFFSVALCLLSGTAYSVLIATEPYDGNVTEPAASLGWWASLSVKDRDPGYGTALYLRNGWMLTAGHVGSNYHVINKSEYFPVAGSTTVMDFVDGGDLLLFKIKNPKPDLPDIALSAVDLIADDLVYVGGYGRSNTGPISGGFGIGDPRVLRWGTNHIYSHVPFNDARTTAWVFDDLGPSPPAGEHEADATSGDSGGPYVTGTGETLVVHGVMTTSSFQGQYGTSVVLGSGITGYKAAMDAIIDVVDCDNGLDDDGNGFIDTADPGCSSGADTLEYRPPGNARVISN